MWRVRTNDRIYLIWPQNVSSGKLIFSLVFYWGHFHLGIASGTHQKARSWNWVEGGWGFQLEPGEGRKFVDFCTTQRLLHKMRPQLVLAARARAGWPRFGTTRPSMERCKL